MFGVVVSYGRIAEIVKYRSKRVNRPNGQGTDDLTDFVSSEGEGRHAYSKRRAHPRAVLYDDRTCRQSRERRRRPIAPQQGNRDARRGVAQPLHQPIACRAVGGEDEGEASSSEGIRPEDVGQVPAEEVSKRGAILRRCWLGSLETDEPEMKVRRHQGEEHDGQPACDERGQHE